jgi:hypothetical protein
MLHALQPRPGLPGAGTPHLFTAQSMPTCATTLRPVCRADRAHALPPQSQALVDVPRGTRPPWPSPPRAPSPIHDVSRPDGGPGAGAAGAGRRPAARRRRRRARPRRLGAAGARPRAGAAVRATRGGEPRPGQPFALPGSLAVALALARPRPLAFAGAGDGALPAAAAAAGAPRRRRPAVRQGLLRQRRPGAGAQELAPRHRPLRRLLVRRAVRGRRGVRAQAGVDHAAAHGQRAGPPHRRRAGWSHGGRPQRQQAGRHPAQHVWRPGRAAQLGHPAPVQQPDQGLAGLWQRRCACGPPAGRLRPPPGCIMCVCVRFFAVRPSARGGGGRAWQPAQRPPAAPPLRGEGGGVSA